jgi:hypothetical protein
VLILDHSGSMRNDYKNGTVQMLVERALGFALQVDVDGEIPVIPFDTKVKKTVPVNLRNYQGIVDSEIFKRRDMGTTDLAAALDVLKEMATKTDAPIFAIIVTDGSPNNRRATTKIVCELADYPVFLKFLAIQPVDYLQELERPGLVEAPRRQRGREVRDRPRRDERPAVRRRHGRRVDTWIKAATAVGIIAT